MDRSVGSPGTRSIVGVHGLGVSVFGLPPDYSKLTLDENAIQWKTGSWSTVYFENTCDLSEL